MSDIIEEKEIPVEQDFDKDEFVPQPEEDKMPKSFYIRLSDISKCPKKSLSPQHYFIDGRCKCYEKKSLKATKAS